MIKFLKRVSFTYMFDTPWTGKADDKLYLQSGQFTSTLKTSQFVGGIDNYPTGISWDDTNTPWCGNFDAKLYLQSGQFTSTLKTSEFIYGIDSSVTGISWDGTNTPWVGDTASKLYLQSGQFTSTLKTSEDISSIDFSVTGISWDGADTPWCGGYSDTLYLQSGQFTSTIKTSEYVYGIDSWPFGISWDGINTLWIGRADNKLYLQSGQFTSTLKTSEYVGGIEIDPTGIETNNLYRLDATFERSLSNTISFSDQVSVQRISIVQLNNIISFNHQLIAQKIPFIQLNNTIPLNHYLITQKIPDLSLIQVCRLNLPRWIFASVTKYFSEIAVGNNLHFFVEGTTRETEKYSKFIEFRMDGPNSTQLSKGFYRLDIEINILWSFKQDGRNFLETERIKGILIDAMSDICIYKFGDGPYDDNSFIGILQLKQNPVRVNNFGQVRSDAKLMQGTVEGSYSMFYSC